MADPVSFTNAECFVTQSLHFDWRLDFDRGCIDGTVQLNVNVLKQTEQFILDTRFIDIKSVTVNGAKAEFKLGALCPAKGQPLTIGASVAAGEATIVIGYATTKECTALQWLTPAQTCGGTHPYMFSQCQAIHARSLFPCQDSPGLKVKYTAAVTCVEPLVALMSANLQHDKTAKNSDGTSTYHFVQDVPMSTYLVAIAGGALESRVIGPRSRVWCEREMVEAAAYEFAETEDYIKAGESLLGPYVWGQYDLLVLPPSFPYGGMENPCLTFVTPTLLAGDRSLANVVAHEIAHSWTGNLVTNSTWEHFWLNEGHTVFIERKIIGRMYGQAQAEFQAIGGWTGQVETVNTFGPNHPYTCLVIKNNGDIDPDDAFSRIPYEKGFSLLWYLQTIFGETKFEAFLKAYIQHFSYKAITTEDWKAFLYSFFDDEKDKLEQVDWDLWFNKPGLAPVKGVYDTSLQEACTKLARKWQSGAVDTCSATDLASFSSGQLQEFLDQLIMGEALSVEVVATMEKTYLSITASKNSEVRFRWIRVGLKARYESAIDNALAMVTEQGRMKFTRPLYRDLGGWDKARPRAIETFIKNRPAMHSTTASLVAKDLGLEK